MLLKPLPNFYSRRRRTWRYLRKNWSHKQPYTACPKSSSIRTKIYESTNTEIHRCKQATTEQSNWTTKANNRPYHPIHSTSKFNQRNVGKIRHIEFPTRCIESAENWKLSWTGQHWWRRNRRHFIAKQTVQTIFEKFTARQQ